MNIFERLQNVFGFTKAERRVALFLIVAFAAGWIIKEFVRRDGAGEAFDTGAADSEFAARSALLDAGFASGPEAGKTAAVAPAPAPGRPLDLNKAGRDQLIALPGIGPALADRIIEYRTQRGPLRRVEDLLNVRGIGRKKLARIAPLVTAGR